MAKINRGRTTKLSIRLSEKAINKIDSVRKNLNLSKAGVILFALSNILKNPPSKEEVINLENKIDLLPKNFPVTVKIEFTRSVDDLSERYGMRKNKLIGLIVSKYFEDLEDEESQENVKGQQVKLQLNVELKEMIDQYSDNHFIPLSGIVSKCLLNGPYKGVPSYNSNDMVTLFTNVPTYLYEEVKEKANNIGIPEHFYISLCIYNSFRGDSKIFE